MEQGLRRQLKTLHDIPAAFIVHPKVVVSTAYGEALARRVALRRRPAKELEGS